MIIQLNFPDGTSAEVDVYHVPRKGEEVSFTHKDEVEVTYTTHKVTNIYKLGFMTTKYVTFIIVELTLA
jgi:hypothetical protein